MCAQLVNWLVFLFIEQMDQRFAYERIILDLKSFTIMFLHFTSTFIGVFLLLIIWSKSCSCPFSSLRPLWINNLQKKTIFSLLSISCLETSPTIYQKPPTEQQYKHSSMYPKVLIPSVLCASTMSIINYILFLFWCRICVFPRIALIDYFGICVLLVSDLPLVSKCLKLLSWHHQLLSMYVKRRQQAPPTNNG